MLLSYDVVTDIGGSFMAWGKHMNVANIELYKECLPDTPTIKHSKSTTCYAWTINEPLST